MCQEEREVTMRENAKKNQEAQQAPVGYKKEGGMSYNAR